jgi:cobalt-zinc-cadmium efflux system outer membrane protein
MVRAMVLGALCVAVSVEAQEPADSLTLTRDQAIAQALVGSPLLAIAREQVAQVRAQGIQASAFPDPEIAADWAGLSKPFRPGTRTGADVSVGVTMPFPQKLLMQGAAGRATVRSAEFAYEQQRQAVVAETAQAYDALLVALQHGRDLAQARQLAADFLQRTEARFAGGTVPRLDVIKARVELAQAENDRIANERDQANARSALNRAMGRLLRLPLVPIDSLTVPAAPPALDSLIPVAMAQRPELRGLDADRSSARSSAAIAQQYFLPDLSLSLEKNVVDGSPDEYTLGLGFSLPLFFWNHQRGEVAEARHRVRELDASYRDLEAGVEQDVRTAWASADAAIRQATYLRDELVPEAQHAYEVVAGSYALGGSSALDVIDARRTLLDAENQYADALGAANDAVFQLRLALGEPVGGAAGESR